MVAGFYKIMDIAPDLAARKILMASHLYYDHSLSIMTDAEYDEMSRYVAENYDLLDPVRMWQLEGPEELRDTGQGFKFTTQAVYAAHHWWARNHGDHTIPHADHCMKYERFKEGIGRYVTVRG